MSKRRHAPSHGNETGNTAKRTRHQAARVAPRGRRSWLATGAVAVAVFVGLVVVSATRSGSGGSSGSSTGASAAAPTGGGNAGDRVGPIALTSIDGQAVSVPTKGRPGALFFTVSSCSSCIPSAQALSSLKSHLGSRVDAVMVDLDPHDSPQYLRQWGEAVGDPSYPLTIDTGGNMVNEYRVQALGTTVVYDGQGRIVSRLIEPNGSELAAAFRKAGVRS
jgi:cytochrome oxidase Cu insertion factor (SCO1/SenC/PrrC family)